VFSGEQADFMRGLSFLFCSTCYKIELQCI